MAGRAETSLEEKNQKKVSTSAHGRGIVGRYDQQG